METLIPSLCIAFSGNSLVAKGSTVEVALALKKIAAKPNAASILIFDAETSKPVELDLRGSAEAITKRLTLVPAEADEQDEKKVGPGRPKLGVISREISLLPRHWEWLASQPGGASVTIRKLVEEAKKKNQGQDELRAAQESVYRFMSVMAGNLADYEEALRALYAKQEKPFKKLVSEWPKDIREHTLKLAKRVF